MTPYALRLLPGQDLKIALQHVVDSQRLEAASVLTGIGSLAQAALRFAGGHEAQILDGPFEILTLSGTLSCHGCHLHLGLADGAGRCVGGHLLEGCIIHTTAEIVLAVVPGVSFRRELDPVTGYRELAIYPIANLGE